MQCLKLRGAKNIVGLSKKLFSSHNFYEYTLNNPSLEALIQESTNKTATIEGVNQIWMKILSKLLISNLKCIGLITHMQ